VGCGGGGGRMSYYLLIPGGFALIIFLGFWGGVALGLLP
jgi:hypothetical protein